MSDLNFGGRITFEFAGRKLVQCEADFVVDPSYFEKSAKANQDGSASFMLKPKLAGIDIKPRDGVDIDWNAMMLLQGNATIVEETTGRTHFLTGCQLTGTPKANLSTGEVDGLRVEGGVYRKLNG